MTPLLLLNLTALEVLTHFSKIVLLSNSVDIKLLVRGRSGRDDNRMFVNKIFAFLSKSFGLYAPTVRPSLVVIRGLVGSGGGICNCVVQPSEVSNDCNSFGNNSSLELLCCVISHLVLLA